MDISIRRAEAQDAEVIHQMICELAEFEQAQDEVTITVAELQAGLEHKQKPFDCIIAEVEIVGGQKVPVGFALCYKSFSTWKGQCYYLDDLYVRGEYRGYGVGKLLLEAVQTMAYTFGAKRLEWICLDWNEQARNFYEQVIGAKCMPEWVKYRLVM